MGCNGSKASTASEIAVEGPSEKQNKTLLRGNSKANVEGKPRDSEQEDAQPTEQEAAFQRRFAEWWTNICKADDFDGVFAKELYVLDSKSTEPAQEVQSLSRTSTAQEALNAFRKDVNYFRLLQTAALGRQTLGIGLYNIVNRIDVAYDKSMDSPSLQYLEPGTTVNVLEVAELHEAQRVRGRIEQPRGWITLERMSDGFRWVEKKPQVVESSQEEVVAGRSENAIEYEAFLDKSDNACLGIEVSSEDGHLLVKSIQAGLVQDYNQTASDKIMQGDRIVEVNGVRSPRLTMYDKIIHDKSLKLKLAHKQNVTSSTSIGGDDVKGDEAQQAKSQEAEGLSRTLITEAVAEVASTVEPLPQASQTEKEPALPEACPTLVVRAAPSFARPCGEGSCFKSCMQQEAAEK